MKDGGLKGEIFLHCTIEGGVSMLGVEMEVSGVGTQAPTAGSVRQLLADWAQSEDLG